MLSIGVKNMNIFKILEKYEPRSMHGQIPIAWDQAKDSFIWDNKGKKYIDFTSGIAVANAGHNNPRIVKSIRDAELYHSYIFPTEIKAKYIKELCEFTGFEKAFFLSSGTESTEAAIKLMRIHTRKKDIISFIGAMHGRTSIAENLKGDYSWATKDQYIHPIPFPPKESFKDSIWWDSSTNMIAGVMIETYQGWSAQFFDNRYIQDLITYCKSRGILVCFDEIQAGFGRTGKMFGYEHYEIPKPDLVCIGKGMTSSVPMSGVLGSAEILDNPGVGDMSSTHSGNPLCCSAALANLREIRKLLPSLEQKEHILFDSLKNVPFDLKVNGRGLVAAIFTESADFSEKVCFEAAENGLLLLRTGKPTIKIMPPLTIGIDVLSQGIEILLESIKKVNNDKKY